MRAIVGADEDVPVVHTLAEELRRRGYELRLVGPPGGTGEQWPDVGQMVARAVVSGEAEVGVACCWTGTGVSIAANKVPGARAALCWDAETARGARRWNDANVLCLSLRWTSDALARDILAAYLDATAEDSERENIARVSDGSSGKSNARAQRSHG